MSHSRKIWVLLSVLMVVSMLAAACQPAATETPAPPPTSAPAQPSPVPPTAMPEQPTAAPAAELMKMAAPDCSYGGIMKSIEAVDEQTVKFTLCQSDASFPSKIAFTSLNIQSAKHLEDTGGHPLEDALGTGPYMVQEWVRGDHLTLVANPNYWGTPPKTKTVIFKWNSEAAARLTSLKSGEADGIDNPDPNDFASIKADTTLKLYPRDALNIFYIGLNNTMPPLDNDMVRQALAIGIDRQAIVDKFYPAGSSVADYFTPCAIPGGCEGTAWPKYDLAAAQKLLADAGFADGFKIKLAYRDVVRSYLPTPGKVAEEIQAQLKKLNIDATIDVQESGTFIDNAQTGKLEMFLLGWGADYPDQTDFMDVFFGKGADVSFGTHWPDLEDVIAKAAALSDQAERNKLYAQANDLVVQHAPMVPVAHGASATVFKAALEGGFASPLGNEIFSVMQIPGQDTLVWVQNAEPLSLYCADESDGETLRACEQIFDSLLTYKVGGTDVVPALADMPTANADSTEWVVKLHPGIKFSDGTPLTANDVVKSYAVQWDASDPLHVGNTGEFYYWSALFYQFLNAK